MRSKKGITMKKEIILGKNVGEGLIIDVLSLLNGQLPVVNGELPVILRD